MTKTAACFVSLPCRSWPVLLFRPMIPSPSIFRHYEFYTFANSDGTPSRDGHARAGGGVQLGSSSQRSSSHYHSRRGDFPFQQSQLRAWPALGPGAFGIGDIEAGIKYRFVQETKHRPMIGTFVMFELPAGNAERGLGVGKTWYKLPLWVQKSFGPWTTYGGGGETVIQGVPGYRNYPFAGWLVQRDLGKKWTLGTEVFYHGPEGLATPQTRPATLIDFGGYYKFRDPGFQLLFCYGHTAVGQSGKLCVPRPLLDLGQEGRGPGQDY